MKRFLHPPGVHKSMFLLNWDPDKILKLCHRKSIDICSFLNPCIKILINLVAEFAIYSLKKLFLGGRTMGQTSIYVWNDFRVIYWLNGFMHKYNTEHPLCQALSWHLQPGPIINRYALSIFLTSKAFLS